MTKRINLVQNVGGEPMTTSQVIAEGVEYEHRAVLQLIRNNLSDFEGFGTVAFEMRSLPGGGRPTQIAHLNEQHSTLLLAYMRNTPVVKKFKIALVHEFFEMKKTLALTPALTEDEIMHQALQISTRKIKALEAKVSEDAPKVDYVDTFVADDDSLKFRTVAADVGVSESALRDLLIRKGWIYRETTKRFSETKGRTVEVNRYSQYSHKRPYFFRSMTHDAPRFKGEVMWTLKVTPAGASAIKRLMQAEVAA